MSEAFKDAPDLRGPDPNEAQRRAADPSYSVWVGASAGSGKTTVLTNRLLRLLLPQPDSRPGTKAEALLCLTFTKAAAREMALRLNKRLGAWAVMDDVALAADMQKLLGRAPNAEEATAARRLFVEVVDAPGGLKIMTIHSFCQSVLGRFPLEAGLTPPFNALDDVAAAELLSRARDEVLADARQKPDSPHGRALHRIAAEVNADAFASLMQDITRESRQLSATRTRHETDKALYQAVCAALNISTDDVNTLLDVAISNNVIDIDGLRRACKVMADFGTPKSDQPKSVSIQNWLDGDGNKRRALLNDYRRQFLTGEDEIRAAIMTKKLAGRYADEDACLRAEAQRLYEFCDRLKAATCARLTCDLVLLGAAVHERYTELKTARAALDFDDLINRTLDLLKDSGMAGWVMYKLDGGIDHILIDEAQDTNPEQWEIVQALCEDFFSGLGTRGDMARTIFTVGDEKQSIYSFQRARPEKFQEMRRHFADRVQAAKQKWRNEEMNFSFRTAPSVLRFVDEVYREDPVRKGLSLSPFRHISQRPDDAGLVELWPLFGTPGKEDRGVWDIVAPRDSRSGAARLAEHIGDTLQEWIGKEPLDAYGRNVAAGDILVLVRRRTAFVNQLIRALKMRGIPVSGIDRMVLKDQLAVQDMLAAAQFALLPEDDLTLACLLKSPFIGWTDEKLEQIAPGRAGSLWDEVKKSSGSDIVAWLDNLIRRGASDHPYEFFAGLLQTPCPADKISGLHAVTARLGAEALDPLDELLNAALDFESDNIAALQGFLLAMQKSDADIKREQEEAGGNVRIMTVHGAKGLEAPIVILPDTVRTTRTPPSGSARRLVWPSRSDLDVPLWSPRSDLDCRFYAVLLDRIAEKEDEEYRRLLYVALTRARDRLYIAGHVGRKTMIAESWYSHAARAMAALRDVQDTPFESPHFLREEDSEAPISRRISNPQKKKPEKKTEAVEKVEPLDPAVLPWLFAKPADEPDPPRPLAPSRPTESEPAAPSPLAASDTYRFRRGNVTHKLLQLLPDLPAAQRLESARAYVARNAADLPDDIRACIVRETMAILENAEWAALFEPGSLAEVPVTGMANGRLISAQIDRLVVMDKEVLIVDYKTNRPPPQTQADIPTLYIRQIDAYRDIVALIYSGRRVRAFLLWTDGPKLMELEFQVPT